MNMPCSNSYELNRYQNLMDKLGEKLGTFDYDRLIEIIGIQFFKGDTRASEGICADNYGKEDYENIASLIAVIHREPGGLLVEEIENFTPVQRAAYAKAGKVFVDRLIDAMSKGAMQQLERQSA